MKAPSLFDPKLGTVHVWSKDGRIPKALADLIASNVRIDGHAHSDPDVGIAATDEARRALGWGPLPAARPVLRVPDPTGMRIAPDTYLTDADRRARDCQSIKHIVTDLSRLVAALRAVLDLAGTADAAADQVMAHGVPAGRVPTIELRRAITEALGGGA